MHVAWGARRRGQGHCPLLRSCATACSIAYQRPIKTNDTTEPLHSHLLHFCYHVIKPHSPLSALGAVGIGGVEVPEFNLAEGHEEHNC